MRSSSAILSISTVPKQPPPPPPPPPPPCLLPSPSPQLSLHSSWPLLPTLRAPAAIKKKMTAATARRPSFGRCRARRRIRYEDDEDDDEMEQDQTYGHNVEMEMLESYSESARSEVLLVRADVDGEEEEVVIFRGFSSCVSGRTAPDPSRSVLPARAVIQSIDVVKGPFDPSNIEYLEKGLTWEAFKIRLQQS